MIGGAMLLCAVGAMVLIAWWSLPRDDEADPATGLLALRSWSERTVSRSHGGAAKRDRRPSGRRDRRPDPAKHRRRR